MRVIISPFQVLGMSIKANLAISLPSFEILENTSCIKYVRSSIISESCIKVSNFSLPVSSPMVAIPKIALLISNELPIPLERSISCISNLKFIYLSLLFNRLSKTFYRYKYILYRKECQGY